MSLIGTGDVRTWLGLEAADRTPNAKLEALCPVAQNFVESYLNRKLEAQRFKTNPDYCYFDGTGQPWIYVPVFPVWDVYEICVDSDREFGTSTQIDLNDLFFYPDGKIMSEAGWFTRGRKNIRIDYYAGYGAGSYPLPYDLKQVMVEMVADAYKSGLTALHATQQPTGEVYYMKMLTNNTFWKETLARYRRIGGFGNSYDDA
jgi:hypothetical protein